MIDLFISHAGEDDEFVNTLYERLKQAGLRPWADHKDIKPSEDWNLKIQEGLEKCEAGLLVLSQHSVNSTACAGEALWVKDSEVKPLFVVKADSVPQSKIPHWLKTIQYIDLSNDFEEGFEQLIQAYEEFSDPSDDISHFSQNIRIGIVTADCFAGKAISSYLSWDRRTRVVFMCSSLDSLWERLEHTSIMELPDVIILDLDHLETAEVASGKIISIREKVKSIRLIGLISVPDLAKVANAIESKFECILLKGEVEQGVASAIVYQMKRKLLIVTPSIFEVTRKLSHPHANRARKLPLPHKYPELTERIRRALNLCILEGMPAHLAADEMGVSLHTIRGYIKEGYRILEAYDDTEYPADMTPQERAFMRLTAFDNKKRSD